MRLARLVWLAPLLLLGACVTRGVQELPPLESWQQRTDVLARLESWTLRGRIGIRTADDASSGNLSWNQYRRTFDAQIDGPLGVGGVRLVGSPDAVTLSGSKVETVTVSDPEVELWRQTGLQVPIEGLRYWLLGIPISGAPAALTLNDDQVAEVIEQSGWTIRYEEYRRWSVNLLPRRVVAQSGDTRLTIIVRDWDIREQDTLSAQ